MIVLVTGISGIGIDKILKKFIYNNKDEFSLLETDKYPNPIKFEDIIADVHYRRNPELPRTRDEWFHGILTQPYPILKLYWEEAFDDIQEILNKINTEKPESCVFIHLHMVYYHKKTNEYVSLLNVDLLKKIKPEMIINFIDDIYEIHHRLTNKGGIYYAETGSTKIELILRLFRLLDWRSKETMMSRFIANTIGDCKFFLISIKHSQRILINLIFHHTPVIYLSHPISEVRRLETQGETEAVSSIISEIEEFSGFLSERFVALLPTTIDELRILSREMGRKKTKVYFPKLKKRWDAEKYKNAPDRLYLPSGFDDHNELWEQEVDEQDSKKFLSIRDLIAVLSDIIGFHVEIRDYTLVELCNFLVIYRPLFNGNLSGGVSAELQYFMVLRKVLDVTTKCFTFCPQEDIDEYFVRQFNSKLNQEIIDGKLESPNAIQQIEISQEEIGKLLLSVNNKSVFKDFIEDIFQNYQLVIPRQRGKLPLKANPTDQYIAAFTDKIFETFGLVNEYKRNSTIFEIEGNKLDNFKKRIECEIIKRGQNV